MNWKAMQWWLTHEAPYAAFWVTAAVAVMCLVGAAVGLIRWVWFLFAGAGVVGSLRALHRAHQREIHNVYQAEADGEVTFDEYVEALRAHW